MIRHGSGRGAAWAAGLALALTSAACGGKAGGGDGVSSIAQARGLSATDVEAAVKTYVPTGKMDDYLMFASGGQSGQVEVIGIPSMRLLKVIGVFTPEPWQGWGTGAAETHQVLAEGRMEGHDLTWGDTHHPAL
jgi:nitrous-oxide reductase